MSGSHFEHTHPEGHASEGAVASSLVYGAPAGLKLAMALALITATVVIPAEHYRWLVGIAALLLFAMVFSLVSPLYVARRLALLLPFILCTVLGAALRPGAGPGWEVVAARACLCLATIVLLSATTPFGAVLGVLRRVGFPGLLVTTLALTHRYLFVLADEMMRMRRARASRSFRSDRRFTWSVLSTVAGRLFERASDRAERIYCAMCARGWKP
jgi:cobalt/nickel transport system permease protein